MQPQSASTAVQNACELGSHAIMMFSAQHALPLVINLRYIDDQHRFVHAGMILALNKRAACSAQ